MPIKTRLQLANQERLVRAQQDAQQRSAQIAAARKALLSELQLAAHARREGALRSQQERHAALVALGIRAADVDKSPDKSVPPGSDHPARARQNVGFADAPPLPTWLLSSGRKLPAAQPNRFPELNRFPEQPRTAESPRSAQPVRLAELSQIDEPPRLAQLPGHAEPPRLAERPRLAEPPSITEPSGFAKPPGITEPSHMAGPSRFSGRTWSVSEAPRAPPSMAASIGVARVDESDSELESPEIAFAFRSPTTVAANDTSGRRNAILAWPAPVAEPPLPQTRTLVPAAIPPSQNLVTTAIPSVGADPELDKEPREIVFAARSPLAPAAKERPRPTAAALVPTAPDLPLPSPAAAAASAELDDDLELQFPFRK